MTRKLHRKEKVALQYDERFGAIECILFVSGDPVPVIQLQRALGLTDIEMQSTLQSMDLFSHAPFRNPCWRRSPLLLTGSL